MQETPENAMQDARATRTRFSNPLFLPLIAGNYRVQTWPR